MTRSVTMLNTNAVFNHMAVALCLVAVLTVSAAVQFDTIRRDYESDKIGPHLLEGYDMQRELNESTVPNQSIFKDSLLYFYNVALALVKEYWYILYYSFKDLIGLCFM